MDERARVAALIDRLVRESGIRTARGRDELRRELESHFDEAGSSAEALADLRRRFGNPETVGAMLQRAHGRTWLAWYALKVAASIVVATAAAVALQLVIDVPAAIGAEGTMVPPRHVLTLFVSLGVVLVAVIVWELGVEALCTRLERHPRRLALAVGGLASGVYVTHTFLSHYLEPRHALAAALILIAVWMLTLAILARADRVFTRFTGDFRAP